MRKSKKVSPPSKEELDIQQLQIRTEHAIATAAELRQRTVVQQEAAAQARSAIERQTEEVDEIYTYLDTQMLHSARERYDYEMRYRREVKERAAEVSALQQLLEVQAAQAVERDARQQRELELTRAELRELLEFRGVRPKMQAEINGLKEELREEREQRCRAEHEQQVSFWRQRQQMHDQMLERIKQAKTNFLDITAEMLDSTVHRTILENQRLGDELAVQSSQIEKLVHSNEGLLSEKRALRREIELQKEQQLNETRRSVARQRLAQTATDQHTLLSEELSRAQEAFAQQQETIARQQAHISFLSEELAVAERQVAPSFACLASPSPAPLASLLCIPYHTTFPYRTTPHRTTVYHTLPHHAAACHTMPQHNSTISLNVPASFAHLSVAPSGCSALC